MPQKSMETELMKTEMLFNKILEIHSDIYEINYEDNNLPTVKSIKENIGEIRGVMILFMGEKGYSRIASTTMDVFGYQDVLLLEAKKNDIMMRYVLQTGNQDLTELSKLLRKGLKE